MARWNNISAPFSIYPGQRISMAAANASATINDQLKPVISEPTQSDTGPIITSKAYRETSIAKPVALAQRPGSVVVRKGDTLYSIARKQGLTHKQLARWNALSAPYAIYPGKKLSLRPASTWANSRIKANVKKPPVVTRSSVTVPKKLPGKVKSWQWPAKGKLVKTFNVSDTNRKGIGIAGNRGQSVRAAATGRVVYSGNGLIHYGNLIIIKHSNTFLSAYAHNRSLLVKEGDEVQKGQGIAQMGTIENGRARLHFEIRKSGKPVNPLRYLPKRKG